MYQVPKFVRIVSVGDGETLRGVGQDGQKSTVRLVCIDAPETSQGISGPWSSRTLQRLVDSQQVLIQPHTKDRYLNYY